jgi:hypothetical protein
LSTKVFVAALLLMAGAAAAKADAPRESRAPGCTFESISAAEQKRFRSRYQRRLREDGKAFADNWLQEQACPSPAQKAAMKQRMVEKWGKKDKQGRPCENYRTVNRATPSPGGGMSMSLVRECAD